MTCPPGQPAPVRIAMWSGPRNISTALMRSWDARGDTAVCDEPLYAHYLEQTGVDHPGADEVIKAHDPDWRAVVAVLNGPVPGGRAIYYQKHMAHHLLPDIETDWLGGFRHAFLVRDPAAMIVSLAKVTPRPRFEDTGLPQQRRIMEAVRDSGGATPVVDADDLLADPPGMLRALCAALDVPFTERMLAWEPGPRPTDGIWATHWYANVERSTGFGPPRPRAVTVPAELRDLLDACRPLYDALRSHRLEPLPAPGAAHSSR